MSGPVILLARIGALPQDSLLRSVQEASDSAVNSLTGAVAKWTHLAPETQLDVFRSLVLIALVVLARAVVLRVMRARVADIRTRYKWRKTITYIAAVVGVLLVGRIWFQGVRDLATFLGLLSAGLAIALRDPIVNLGGWLFIIWRRPFVVGDRIQVGDHAGDVIDQRIFQIILLEIGNWVDADQSTGRLIHIPNGLVFREPLANYTRGMQYILERGGGAGDLRERLATREGDPLGHRRTAHAGSGAGGRGADAQGEPAVHDLLFHSDPDGVHRREGQRDHAHHALPLPPAPEEGNGAGDLGRCTCRVRT